ncbi:MAG: PIG-L family deacetylase [Planctomycetes bacterium]|nr:PIG-L family deacetylase [Planctomycetota bacterium]
MRRSLAARLDRLLARRATPLRDDELARRTLVVAPHPDDETLGCGGTIARLRALGAPVTVAVAADGSRSHRHLLAAEALRERRAAELVAACAELGVAEDHVVRLGFEDGTLEAHREDLARAIATLLAERDIERLFVPLRAERIQDHVAVHDAGIAAVRARLDRTVEVFEYPVWLCNVSPFVRPEAFGLRGRLRAARDSFAAVAAATRLNRQVELGAMATVKSRALARHETQMRRIVDDPRWLTLADVSSGAWLERLLGPREFFATSRVQTRR